MLHALTRWFKAAPKPAAGWPEVAAWAVAHGWVFRGVRESDGFVIEGRSGAMPWRVEWGPSQRAYIDGFELRFRAELPVPGEMQVLLLSRPLMELMERTVFDQYIEGVQTRIDTEIPPEMRWLVMFPKLGTAELKTLREGYAAVTNHKPWATQWLGAPLATAVKAAPLPPGVPLVLMVARARLSIRTPLTSPTPALLESWMKLFDVALREARRAAAEEGSGTVASTQPSMWASSGLPVPAPQACAIRS